MDAGCERPNKRIRADSELPIITRNQRDEFYSLNEQWGTYDPTLFAKFLALPLQLRRTVIFLGSRFSESVNGEGPIAVSKWKCSGKCKLKLYGPLCPHPDLCWDLRERVRDPNTCASQHMRQAWIANNCVAVYNLLLCTCAENFISKLDSP